MEEFKLRFPVWTVGIVDGSGRRRFATVRVTVPDLGNCLPLFSVFHLVDQFVERRSISQKSQHEMIKIEDAKSLAMIVRSLAENGSRYIVLDFLSDHYETSGAFITVQNILDASERRRHD